MILTLPIPICIHSLCFKAFFPFFPHTYGPAVANWTNQLLLLKRREKQHKISISLDLPVNLNGFYIPTICYAYPLYMCLSAPHDKPCTHNAFTFNCTLFKNQNKFQKKTWFQFHFLELLGTFPMSKQERKICSIIRHWRLFHLFVLGSRWKQLRFFFEISKVVSFIVIQLGHA